MTFVLSVFFFNDTATTEIYTLSLHDALPISSSRQAPVAALQANLDSKRDRPCTRRWLDSWLFAQPAGSSSAGPHSTVRDRKSTRLNSSNANISHAVFCLKKNITIPEQSVLLY